MSYKSYSCKKNFWWNHFGGVESGVEFWPRVHNVTYPYSRTQCWVGATTLHWGDIFEHNIQSVSSNLSFPSTVMHSSYDWWFLFQLHKDKQIICYDFTEQQGVQRKCITKNQEVKVIQRPFYKSSLIQNFHTYSLIYTFGGGRGGRFYPTTGGVWDKYCFVGL